MIQLHRVQKAMKNRCFWTVVLEKTLESPLDCKEIQPVYPKGNQSWIFIGSTDAEAETPILWPPDAKNWLFGKDPAAAAAAAAQLLQSCRTLCDPVDSSPTGSPILGILQARILEWVAVREGDDRGWDGWMASLTWWTWVWASSGNWWWMGKPGILQSMGSQRIRRTEQLNWLTETSCYWTQIYTGKAK